MEPLFSVSMNEGAPLIDSTVRMTESAIVIIPSLLLDMRYPYIKRFLYPARPVHRVLTRPDSTGSLSIKARIQRGEINVQASL